MLLKINYSLAKKILLLVFLVFATKSLYADDFSSFNRNVKNYNKNLVIFDKKSPRIAEFRAAIADNDQKRQFGLMNLERLDEQKGMLFLFEKPDIIYMWMKNTLIPLDMIFINGDEIVAIKENAQPLSLDVISSQFSIDKVLEINAGLVKKYGIKTTQKIRF